MAKRIVGPDLLFQNAFQLSTAPSEVLSILNEKKQANLRWEKRVPEDGHIRWAQSQFIFKIGAQVTGNRLAGGTTSEQCHVLKEATGKGGCYRLVADTLKQEAHVIAESWIGCGKQIGAPEADELYRKAGDFLKFSHQTLLPHPLTGLFCLSYTHKKSQTIRDQIDWQLGWLCLCLAVSTWSKDLCQCPRCKDFYVKKRDTQGANPGCCHECRRSDVESQTEAKKRSLARAQKKMLKEAQQVIDELANLPSAKPPRNRATYIAKEVSQRLKLKSRITSVSITKWSEEGKLKGLWD